MMKLAKSLKIYLTTSNFAPTPLYGEKLWQEERLVNLANDHKVAKIYPANFSNVVKAIVIKF